MNMNSNERRAWLRGATLSFPKVPHARARSLAIKAAGKVMSDRANTEFNEMTSCVKMVLLNKTRVRINRC
jgi:hypothetical protein